jgi:hypothetical protein
MKLLSRASIGTILDEVCCTQLSVVQFALAVEAFNDLPKKTADDAATAGPLEMTFPGQGDQCRAGSQISPW